MGMAAICRCTNFFSSLVRERERECVDSIDDVITEQNRNEMSIKFIQCDISLFKNSIKCVALVLSFLTAYIKILVFSFLLKLLMYEFL